MYIYIYILLCKYIKCVCVLVHVHFQNRRFYWLYWMSPPLQNVSGVWRGTPLCLNFSPSILLQLSYAYPLWSIIRVWQLMLVFTAPNTQNVSFLVWHWCNCSENEWKIRTESQIQTNKWFRFAGHIHQFHSFSKKYPPWTHVGGVRFEASAFDAFPRQVPQHTLQLTLPLGAKVSETGAQAFSKHGKGHPFRRGLNKKKKEYLPGKTRISTKALGIYMWFMNIHDW